MSGIDELADELEEQAGESPEGGQANTSTFDVEEAEVVTVEDSTSPKPDNALLTPVSDVDDLVDVYDKFEQIKSELLTESDLENIQGRAFITKSGWRKIATAFNISVDTISSEVTRDDGVVTARVVARATAPNGKSSSNVGTCASSELRFLEEGSPPDDKEENPNWNLVNTRSGNQWRRIPKPKFVNEHDLVATAETRAKNRAISDCVGGGEVSADEVKKGKSDIFQDEDE